MKKTTIRLSYDTFWALEGYRVFHKLGSKDEALRKLLKNSKKMEVKLNDK